MLDGTSPAIFFGKSRLQKVAASRIGPPHLPFLLLQLLPNEKELYNLGMDKNPPQSDKAAEIGEGACLNRGAGSPQQQSLAGESLGIREWFVD